MTFWVTAGMMAASAALTTYGQMESGRAQENALRHQADQERIAAEGRELGRQQELEKALAANVVGLSLSGMEAEGTPASIALESAKQIGLSEGMTKLSDRLQQAQLRRQGANARAASKLAAGSTLLEGASSIYQIE